MADKEIKAPKVGDKVNVVPPAGPSGGKPVTAEVLKVSPDGLVIDAKVINSDKVPTVVKNAPFLSKEAFAKNPRRNTWHFLLVLLFAALAFAMLTPPAMAADFVTRTSAAGTTNGIAFEGRNSSGMVLTSYDVVADAAGSELRFYLGNTPFALASNATAAATNVYLTTAAHGLVAGNRVIIQNTETAKLCIVFSTNGTLVNFLTTIGISNSAGSTAWGVSSNSTPMALQTNRLSGEIFGNAKRRPLAIEINGTAAKVTGTVRYD